MKESTHFVIGIGLLGGVVGPVVCNAVRREIEESCTWKRFQEKHEKLGKVDIPWLVGMGISMPICYLIGRGFRPVMELIED